ncbi:hypothetical protein N7536_012013 [Penicillium majusculum]|uniref:Uncharacterized protein n=1 Tax=Penicillium solitum TaxID=60172 RepID=A0A1V6R5Q1_9EURO|nr:uncharacterized protein PENSOL_c014G11322 [Penicillium solitum]KAJ5680874.1 hypothetical protein N7536_012013 [Penicillium majusculum]OQD96825.1 hypothetical protein PENSOL_c014G11322 [Penicillium solitum]
MSPPPRNPTMQHLSEPLDDSPRRNIRAFQAHPQCQPPSTHPTIFFLYDFVRNSHNQLKAVDAEKYAAGDNAAKTAVNEIEGRNAFTNMLINDKSRKLSMMTGGDPSNPADFGPEIKNKALILTQ